MIASSAFSIRMLSVSSSSSKRGFRPVSFSSFFTGTPGYLGNPFDPNVLYDEEEDRFFLGIDSAGGAYCFAVTTSSDPTTGRARNRAWCSQVQASVR